MPDICCWSLCRVFVSGLYVWSLCQVSMSDVSVYSLHLPVTFTGFFYRPVLLVVPVAVALAVVVVAAAVAAEAAVTVAGIRASIDPIHAYKTSFAFRYRRLFIAHDVYVARSRCVLSTSTKITCMLALNA